MGVLDDTKCLNYQSSLGCDATHYWDSAAAGTSTTAATKKTSCCTAKATCASGSCSPGYKKKASLTGLTCTYKETTAASCNSACCELQTPNAACSAGSCSPGYKKKASLTGLTCSTADTSAASCNTNCCVLDDTKCLNYASSIVCGNRRYWTTGSAGTATAVGGASKNTDCCTAKATCAAFFPPPPSAGGGGGPGGTMNASDLAAAMGKKGTSDAALTAPALPFMVLSTAAVLLHMGM